MVAVGCLAERYGDELAAALPEADAVLGFDAYPDLAALLGDVLDGARPGRAHPGRPAHPAADQPGRPAGRGRTVSVPGHDPIPARERAGAGPQAAARAARSRR